MNRNNWKTYKINLTNYQEEFLKNKKREDGTTLSWMLTKAVELYIKKCESESINGIKKILNETDTNTIYNSGKPNVSWDL